MPETHLAPVLEGGISNTRDLTRLVSEVCMFYVCSSVSCKDK